MNIKRAFFSILFALLFLITPNAIADTQISHAPPEAQAYIVEPANGSTLPTTFTVKFGLSGMNLAPAGTEQKNTGHHHLLIDQSELPNLQASLPSTERVRHFGKAQTQTKLTLSPGEHTLRLVLGDYAHIPHDNPVISEPIKITVK